MTTLTTAWFLSKSIHQAASLHGSAGGHGACLDGPFRAPFMCFFFFCVCICICVFFIKRGRGEGLNVYVCACVSPWSARQGPRPQNWWNATLRSPGGDANELNGSTFGRFCSRTFLLCLFLFFRSLSNSPAAETEQECRAATALAFWVEKV